MSVRRQVNDGGGPPTWHVTTPPSPGLRRGPREPHPNPETLRSHRSFREGGTPHVQEPTLTGDGRSLTPTNLLLGRREVGGSEDRCRQSNLVEVGTDGSLGGFRVTVTTYLPDFAISEFVLFVSLEPSNNTGGAGQWDTEPDPSHRGSFLHRLVKRGTTRRRGVRYGYL